MVKIFERSQIRKNAQISVKYQKTTKNLSQDISLSALRLIISKDRCFFGVADLKYETKK
jgi:hypothetical protein